MKDLNKVIYDGVVYVKVNDLVELFEGVSLYKIKKEIKEQELPTCKLKGFGNGLFIREKDASMLVIDGKSILLSTKVRTANSEANMCNLLGVFFGKNETTDKLINDKLNKFLEEEEYINESKPVATQEVDEFNKSMEEEGLAYRRVTIGLKNTNVSASESYDKFETELNFLVNKDMDIVCDPYNCEKFEIEQGKLYIGWNDICEGDLDVDYEYQLPLEYGEVNIDKSKILKNIYKSINEDGIKITEWSDSYYLLNGKLTVDDLTFCMLMRNDTVITKFSW